MRDLVMALNNAMDDIRTSQEKVKNLIENEIKKLHAIIENLENRVKKLEERD